MTATKKCAWHNRVNFAFLFQGQVPSLRKNLLPQLCVLSSGKHLNNKITQSYKTSEKVFQKSVRMSPCINKICTKIQRKVSSFILFVKGNTMGALCLGNPYHAEARMPPKKQLVWLPSSSTVHLLGLSVGGRGVCTWGNVPHRNSITTMAAVYEQNYSTVTKTVKCFLSESPLCCNCT